MLRLIATLLVGLLILPFFMLAVLGTALIVTPYEWLGRRLRRSAPQPKSPSEDESGQHVRAA